MFDAKYVDISIAQSVVGTTPTVQHISVVPQGDTVNTRDGKSFRVKSASFRGRINQDSTSQVNAVRISLVWDYQPNKALAGYTDIYDSAQIDSFPKRENAHRFKIIRSWTYMLTGNSALATPTSGAFLEDYVYLPGDSQVLCTAADTTGAIANVIQGALLFTTIATAAAGTNDCVLAGNARINFVDYAY